MQDIDDAVEAFMKRQAELESGGEWWEGVFVCACFWCACVVSVSV